MKARKRIFLWLAGAIALVFLTVISVLSIPTDEPFLGESLSLFWVYFGCSLYMFAPIGLASEGYLHFIGFLICQKDRGKQPILLYNVLRCVLSTLITIVAVLWLVFGTVSWEWYLNFTYSCSIALIVLWALELITVRLIKRSEG